MTTRILTLAAITTIGFTAGYVTARYDVPAAPARKVAADESEPHPIEVHHYFLKSDHEPAADWSYEGATGPANWAS